MALGFRTIQKCAFVLLLGFTYACGSRRVVSESQQTRHVALPDATAELVPRDTSNKPVPRVEIEMAPNSRILVSSVERADSGTWKGNIQRTLDSLCNTTIFETTQLGLYVYDLTDDSPLYALNAGQRMRPASSQKLVTAIAALHYLGSGYKFKTDVRISGQVQNGTLLGDVYVVGSMDPMLSKDDLRTMADALRQKGIAAVNGHLYTDLSMKDDLPYGWGWCWDDDYGPLSALTVDGKDRFASAWPEALSTAGLQLQDATVMQKRCDANAKSAYTLTRNLQDVLIPMMKESNNIYAESVFYQVAASTGVKQAGRKQAAKRISDLITNLGLKASRYQIADGSGLSLYNYVTPELMVRLLNFAYTKENIRPSLYASLPIAGVDGTLSKRLKDSPAYNNVHAKTGTVEGISSLCGYLTAANGHVITFAIINQGIIYTSTGKDFQDKVCTLLCK